MDGPPEDRREEVSAIVIWHVRLLLVFRFFFLSDTIQMWGCHRARIHTCILGLRIVRGMVSSPSLDPLHDPSNVALEVLGGFALQLDDDLGGVGVAGLVEDDLHDLGLVVLLDLLEGVVSGKIVSTEDGRKVRGL